ncbi:MAG: hypothetical protein H8F28_01090 [Fibrella sp.]|nr:hypothetical protein [Armatimonadota bacterium]
MRKWYPRATGIAICGLIVCANIAAVWGQKPSPVPEGKSRYEQAARLLRRGKAIQKTVITGTDRDGILLLYGSGKRQLLRIDVSANEEGSHIDSVIHHAREYLLENEKVLVYRELVSKSSTIEAAYAPVITREIWDVPHSETYDRLRTEAAFFLSHAKTGKTKPDVHKHVKKVFYRLNGPAYPINERNRASRR